MDAEYLPNNRPHNARRADFPIDNCDIYNRTPDTEMSDIRSIKFTFRTQEGTTIAATSLNIRPETGFLSEYPGVYMLNIRADAGNLPDNRPQMYVRPIFRVINGISDGTPPPTTFAAEYPGVYRLNIQANAEYLPDNRPHMYVRPIFRAITVIYPTGHRI